MPVHYSRPRLFLCPITPSFNPRCPLAFKAFQGPHCDSWSFVISAEGKQWRLLSFSSFGGMYKRKRQVPDPAGGLEFLPISLMKVSNYSTRQSFFQNQEGYLKSSLAGYSILLLKCLWESLESLLSLVWLGLLDWESSCVLAGEGGIFDIIYIVSLASVPWLQKPKVEKFVYHLSGRAFVSMCFQQIL